MVLPPCRIKRLADYKRKLQQNIDADFQERQPCGFNGIEVVPWIKYRKDIIEPVVKDNIDHMILDFYQRHGEKNQLVYLARTFNGQQNVVHHFDPKIPHEEYCVLARTGISSNIILCVAVGIKDLHYTKDCTTKCPTYVAHPEGGSHAVLTESIVYDIGFYMVTYLTRLGRDGVKIDQFKPDFNHARFIRSAPAGSPLVNAYLAYIPFGYIFQIRSLREILPGEEICLAAGHGLQSNQFHCSEEDIAVDTGEGLHNIVTALLEDSKKRGFYFPLEVPFNVPLEHMFSNNSSNNNNVFCNK